MAFDFKHLKAEDIKAYMSENATPKQKKDFMEVAFPAVPKKKAVKLFDEEGKPIMFQLKDKAGNLKYNEDGSPMMRQKTEMKAIKGGATERVFSLLEAKWWFSENFPEAVDNVPEKKEKKATAKDIFTDWL